MAADSNLALMAVLVVVGALILVGFFAWIRKPRNTLGRKPCCRPACSTTALEPGHGHSERAMGGTAGTSFCRVAPTSQVVGTTGRDGVIFTAAHRRILCCPSLAAGRLAKRSSSDNAIAARWTHASLDHRACWPW